MLKAVVLAALFVGAAGLVAVGSPARGAAAIAQGGVTPVAESTQTNESGQVSVSVTWAGSTSGLVFQVALNSHSVNLDAYNLGDLAVLRTGQGLELRPTSWVAPKGGHHREGTLVFPGQGPDGTDVLTSNVREMTLIIRDIAGVPERTFRWTW